RTGASRRISPLSQGAIRAAGADGGVEACAPGEKRRSRPISRVLSRAVIPLGAASPLRSSGLPGPDAGRVMGSLFGLAPGGVCRAGLLPGSRCALTAPFHPCHAPGALADTWPFGGLLSVALSVGSRRPGVTWHRALWSPDFPRCTARAHRDCLADSAAGSLRGPG